MYFRQFYDDKLAQYAYLIGCQANGTAVIIDPMRDIDTYIDAAARENLTIVAAADTHIHADYLSGLRAFAEQGVKVYASDEGGEDWRYEWLLNSRGKYDYELLKDGDTFNIGSVTIRAWHTPGHTPEHLSYYITDGAAADEPIGLVTGDFVFAGDVGRPDLLETAAGLEQQMEPSARVLYNSVEQFKTLPEYMQVWPGHGAGSACGKAMSAVPDSTVGYEIRFNSSIRSSTSEDDFVSFILDGQPEPPYYFARMKRDNKMGPSLASMPRPVHLTIGALEGLTGREGRVLLDTRERHDFIESHIPGSLLSPLNRQFNTVAGSYIREDEEICLIVEEHQVEEAVRDLYRIGLDKVTGYVTPRDLELYRRQGGRLKSLESVTFDAVKDTDEKTRVLDVRGLGEYETSHVEGALHIPHTRLLPRSEELDRNLHYLVHCQTGVRSSVATAMLRRNGFDVTLVDDDFARYEEQVKLQN